jgi:hypothetical protein
MRVVRALEWVTRDRRRAVVAALAVALLSGTAVALAVARDGRSPAERTAAGPTSTATSSLAPAATALPPSPGTSATDGLASTSASGNDGTGVSGASPTPSRRQGRVTRVIVWLQEFGPDSGGLVPSTTLDLYTQLRLGDCESVQAMGDPEPDLWWRVYRGAGAACLAAFHGRTDLWAQAAADARAAAGVSGSCHDGRVLTLLRTLVQAHEEDPGVILRRSDAPGGELPCPQILSLSPDHGSVDGGYEVVATGKHLPPTVRIELDAMATVVGRSNAAGTRTVFTMPPADPTWLEQAAGTALLVQTEVWPGDEAAEFAYDEPSGGGTGG